MRDALAFLTVLPFLRPPVDTHPAQRMSRALVWFPVVGALVGASAGAVVFWASSRWEYSVAALLGVVVLSAMTGGLHLDGFSDTVDGLAARRSGPTQTLQVMRDSRIGALGCAALFLLLGFKWVLIEAVATHSLVRVLATACSFGRFSLVLSAQSFPYVPGDRGLGRAATDQRSPAAVILALLITAGVGVAGVGPWNTLLCLGLTAGLVWILNRLFLIRLGGITGDTLGAVNEVVEVSILLALTMR